MLSEFLLLYGLIFGIIHGVNLLILSNKRCFGFYIKFYGRILDLTKHGERGEHLAVGPIQFFADHGIVVILFFAYAGFMGKAP